MAAWVKQISGRNGLNGQRSENTQTVSTSSTKSNYPEFAANAALVLIAVACSLLDRQLIAQAAAFEKEGGFTERLYKKRREAKGSK